MAEAETKDPGWIGAWLEQQRELLRRQAAKAEAQEGKNGAGQQAPDTAAQIRELGTKWLDVGQSYLQGLMQYAQGAPADAGQPPSKLGEELLAAWRGAWAQADAAGESFMGAMPAIGLLREHTEAWRELTAARAECQRLEQELRTVLSQVQSDALELLEQRVKQLAQSSSPVNSYRTLYDLWVDCGEQVYAKVAHSEAYCRLQAQLGNATMRLRSRQQKVIEQSLKQYDLPTRSELNTVHRQLRELREKIAALAPQPAPLRSAEPAGAAAKRDRKPATKSGKARRAAASSAPRRASRVARRPK